jgi:hypothetical protein
MCVGQHEAWGLEHGESYRTGTALTNESTVAPRQQTGEISVADRDSAGR